MARDRADPARESAGQVLEDCVRAVNATGRLGVVGVYPRGERLELPWADVFDKGLRLGTGRTNDRRYKLWLRDAIMARRLEPGRIVSQEVPLAEAPEAYHRFDRREPGWHKVVLRP